MKIGSSQHKKEFFQNLIKTYQENIWTDEINIFRLEIEKADKQQEMKGIEKKLEAKGFSTANEGNKAKFVVEREIAHLDQKMAELENQIKTWFDRIEFIKAIQKPDKKK